MTTWAPTEEILEETTSPEPARRLHALFDAPGAAPSEGDALPALWHWLHFLPRAPQSELGTDGHPASAGFLPPAPHPRRMFAGAEVTIERPLRIGSTASRRAVASPPTEKVGRSGPIAFVTATYKITDSRGGLLTETQNLVYRPADARSAAREPTELPGSWPWESELVIDERFLFRFSALTYNAHRIHYDRPYATQIEGYPGLVVHGPLLALSLAELIRQNSPDAVVEAFSFRAHQPAFAPATIRLLGRNEGLHAHLTALDEHGVVLMSAKAMFACLKPPS